MVEFKVRVPSGTLKRRSIANETASLQDRVESILTENSYRAIQFVDISQLIPFKNQKRKYFDNEKLKNLAETIREHGIRQPLTVIQSEESLDQFEIVSGERRFLAAKMIGLDKVPCIVIHARKAAEEIAVIENVQRADLHPIELGKAYNSLLENGVISSHNELAKKIGVPRTQISEYITFSTLPDYISDQLIVNGIFARQVLRKFSKCSSEQEMLGLIKQVLHKTNGNGKKIIATFALVDNDINIKMYDNLKLSKDDLSKLISKVEDFAQSIRSKLNS